MPVLLSAGLVRATADLGGFSRAEMCGYKCNSFNGIVTSYEEIGALCYLDMCNVRMGVRA